MTTSTISDRIYYAFIGAALGIVLCLLYADGQYAYGYDKGRQFGRREASWKLPLELQYGTARMRRAWGWYAADEPAPLPRQPATHEVLRQEVQAERHETQAKDIL